MCCYAWNVCPTKCNFNEHTLVHHIGANCVNVHRTLFALGLLPESTFYRCKQSNTKIYEFEEMHISIIRGSYLSFVLSYRHNIHTHTYRHTNQACTLTHTFVTTHMREPTERNKKKSNGNIVPYVMLPLRSKSLLREYSIPLPYMIEANRFFTFCALQKWNGFCQHFYRS